MQLPNGSDSPLQKQANSLQAERCQCCPYGFHIDLDFVNFAQEIVAGRKNPDTTSRRQTPIAFENAKRAAKQQLNESIPPNAFRSISKRSLNEIVNDLNEISQYSEKQQMSPNAVYADENVGFSTLPSKISSKNIAWSPTRQTPLLDSPMNSGNWSDIRDTSKTPLTVSANEEVQQILQHQPRRSVISAPTSPVPRTFYTAIGQSLAHLRDKTPVSQISKVDHSYTTTSSTPRRSVFSTTPDYGAAAKPPLPRRYFDGIRRNRVLSPDPETSSASPNLLRSSNLQSRTYFKPSNSTTELIPKTIPYRSRFSNGTPSFTSTGSSLFDSFASVKRSLGLSLADESRSHSPISNTYTPTQQLLQSTQTQTPPIQFTLNKKYRDSPTQTRQNNTKDANVSTFLEKKSIGTLVVPSQNSVLLDTSGLEVPLPKPPQLSLEFQYCIGNIGHDLENMYEELPDVEPPQKHSKSTSATPYTKHASTLCRPISMNNRTQTDQPIPKIDNETQTSDDWLMKEVRSLMAIEKAERKSVDKKTETDCEDGEFIMITCSRCQQPIDAGHYEKIIVNEDEETKREDSKQSSSPQTVTIKSSSSSSDQDEGLGLIEPLDLDLIEQQDKSESEHLSPPNMKSSSPLPTHCEDTKSLNSLEEREMLANLDQLANLDPDRFSLTSVQTVICVQSPQQVEVEETPRQLDPVRTEAIRKLLTEPQSSSAFQRESATNRSYRVEKKSLDLDYILDKHSTNERSPSTISIPSDDPERALKQMVVLKKYVSLPSTLSFPDPIPAKIPRPKFTKFSQVVEQAETPDEAAEAVDKLTPLRSELQYLNGWRSGPQYRRMFRHHQYPNYPNRTESSFPFNSTQSPPQEDSDEEIGNVSTSNSSITSLEEDASSNDDDTPVEFEMTPPLKEALETLNKHLANNELEESSNSMDWATKYVQHQWLQIATRKSVSVKAIKEFIDTTATMSHKLLETVVNFVDQNGNTACHYAVSHENFDVISTLLDTKVCRVDENNKAGYSPLMLAALCSVKNETESAIIQRLFERGNVNAKAVYHGQTALMLSTSHGKIETTNLLLKLSADVNIQDIDGSTALMCAAEHGHTELVKILLKQPKIDATLCDIDNQTALSIAVENGHRDIGVLIYGFLNHSRVEHHESNSL